MNTPLDIAAIEAQAREDIALYKMRGPGRGNALLAARGERTLALAAALRKLRWCVSHTRDMATLLLVTDAAVEAYLQAHGWRAARAIVDLPHTRWYGLPSGGYYGPEVSVMDPGTRVYFKDARAEDEASMRAEWAQWVVTFIAEKEQRSPAEVLCALLPEHGPWEQDHGE